MAFSAYTYLLAEAGPARASTHAFVNPVVAVVLLTIGRGKQPAEQSSLLATECAGG